MTMSLCSIRFFGGDGMVLCCAGVGGVGSIDCYPESIGGHVGVFRVVYLGQIVLFRGE
jgi:hypothetical protein